jgi:hypothetical protein
VNGQTAPVNGQTAPVNGQTAPVNGQTAPVNGQGAPVNGQTAPVNGQTAPVNGQTAPVNRRGRSGTVTGFRDASLVCDFVACQPRSSTLSALPVRASAHWGAQIQRANQMRWSHSEWVSSWSV